LLALSAPQRAFRLTGPILACDFSHYPHHRLSKDS